MDDIQKAQILLEMKRCPNCRIKLITKDSFFKKILSFFYLDVLTYYCSLCGFIVEGERI